LDDSFVEDKKMPPSCQEKAAPDFPAVARFFAWLGLISFGGPAGQIAILREELVEKRQWLSNSEFSAGLNYCLLLPGPEAHQLIIYTGWKLHGLRGAVAAGTLFVLPAALLLWALAGLYASYGQLASAQTLFGTIRPAVLAIIVAALLRMGQLHLKDTRSRLLALGAFSAMFFFGIAFPWIIAAALGLGAVKHLTSPPIAPAVPDETSPARRRPWWWLVVGLLLWALPVGLAAVLCGPAHILTVLGLFFSKTAVLTFGGAYAVLPYVADQAVNHAGWISSTMMKDGLALAETTPGPLIIVLQFVGFLAAWNQPTPLGPLAMATLGAAITTWVTFLPGFLFILAGAPYVDRLSRSPRAQTILGTLTATVIGVIAKLAAWFAGGIFAIGQPWLLHGVIAVIALWLLVGQRWSVPAVIASALALGVARMFF
jgi:chromate transporter